MDKTIANSISILFLVIAIAVCAIQIHTNSNTIADLEITIGDMQRTQHLLLEGTR
jgi:hypothetical protein